MKNREGKRGGHIYDLHLTPHFGSCFLKKLAFTLFHSFTSKILSRIVLLALMVHNLPEICRIKQSIRIS